MADMMAVVSKAVFEKMARAASVGDVLPLDRYSSGNKALEPLGDDGARLFLFTVRPPDEALWLVGILSNLSFDGTSWVGATNTTPITDVGPIKAQIQFESGVGITAKPGTLGMSLQTPRALTAGDVAVLVGASGGGASPETPSAVDAGWDEPAEEAPAPAPTKKPAAAKPAAKKPPAKKAPAKKAPAKKAPAKKAAPKAKLAKKKSSKKR